MILAAAIAFAWLSALTLKGFFMSAALDRLKASMAANASATASAIALISTLAGEIRNAIGDDDALNALADKLDAENGELAAAVTANTPASDPAADVPGGTPATDQAGNVTTGQGQPGDVPGFAPTDPNGAQPIASVSPSGDATGPDDPSA